MYILPLLLLLLLLLLHDDDYYSILVGPLAWGCFCRVDMDAEILFGTLHRIMKILVLHLGLKNSARVF